jgi:hypothetical protein
MKVFARLMLAPFALLTLGAAPSDRLIPVGKNGEAITVPASSSVRLRRIERDDRVLFSGRIVVAGTWILDCDYCEPGQKDNELHLSIVPDAATVARLPRWKVHDNDIRIDITNAGRFIRSVSTAEERKRLLEGTITEIRGHGVIVVDQYLAELICDSASYSARLVSVAQVAKRATLPTDGDYGCGYA